MIENGYYNWKSKIDASVPDNMKIGDDLFIVENADYRDSINVPRKVDVSTFIIIDKGDSYALVDGREYHIQSPCIAVVLPNQTYQLLKASDDISFRIVILSRRFTDGLFGSFPQSNELFRMIYDNPVLDISTDMVSFNTYYKVLMNAVKSPFKMFRLETAKHLTLSMLYYYARKLENLERENEKMEMVFEKFCTSVRVNHRINRSLSFYCGTLGVGQKLLTDTVKKKTGMTAAEYIDNLTVIECKALLVSTDLSVNQISRSMGFVSPSVFGKFFKRMTGFSPSEYRSEAVSRSNFSEKGGER